MSDLSENEYEKCFKDFNIVDCSARSRDVFYFIAREDYTKWPKKKWNPEDEEFPLESNLLKNVVVYFRDRDIGKRWSWPVGRF